MKDDVSKVVPKVSNISQMLHAIPSIDNRMRFSFDTIDMKYAQFDIFVVKVASTCENKTDLDENFFAWNKLKELPKIMNF